MELRERVKTLLTAAVVARLEVRARAAVQRALDGRDPVERSELDALRAAIAQNDDALGNLHDALRRVRAAVQDAPRRPRGPTLTERAASVAAAAGAQEDEADRLTAALGEVSDGAVRGRARADTITRRLDEASALTEAAEALCRAATASTAPTAAAPPVAGQPAAAAYAAPPETPKVCTVPGCESPHRARGFCGKHYQQVRRGQLPGFSLPS